MGRQVKELRALACGLRNLYENGTNLTRVQVAGLTTAVEVMSEAADTIEGLRDRLQATVETCHWEYPQGVSGWRGYCECSACGYRLYEGNGINEKEWTYCPNCRREFKEVDA